jgi:hypothetical protein
MSEMSQGPGWWRASDGRWYPPSAPPLVVQPSPPGYAPLERRTNGLAVASLVLSLLWLAGLGSLLAVIFGISSRRSIKKSRGQETGGGLAIAGLTLGILGIFGSVLFYGAVAAVDHAAHQVSTHQVVALGRPLDVPSAGNVGIRRVTVYSLTYPVSGSNGRPDPVAGKEYAAADVGVCAGPDGSQNGLDPLFFDLLFRDGQTVGIAPTLFPKQPDLGSFQGIGANRCVRGFVTFEIATGTIPTTVRYWPDPFHSYEWTLPR